MQKSGFPKMRHYVGFSQIGSHIRKEVKSQIRSAQAKYDQQLIEKLQTNPKALYGYMRNKLGLKPRIGQLVKSDGSLTDSDGETAEVLNNFFQSVFTNEYSCTTEIFSNSISQLSDITFTESEVFKPGAHRPARAWFLKIDPVRIVGMRACVCVCVRARGY